MKEQTKDTLSDEFMQWVRILSQKYKEPLRSNKIKLNQDCCLSKLRGKELEGKIKDKNRDQFKE